MSASGGLPIILPHLRWKNKKSVCCAPTSTLPCSVSIEPIIHTKTHHPHQVGPGSVCRVSLTQRVSRARLSLECGNQSLNFMPKGQARDRKALMLKNLCEGRCQPMVSKRP